MSKVIKGFEIVVDNIDSMKLDGSKDKFGVGNILRCMATFIERDKDDIGICDNTGKKFGHMKVHYKEKDDE